MDRGEAFGHPGVAPHWSSAAKVGIGTAVSTRSRVWFTVAGGRITEVYYPRVDVANIQQLQFLVTDGATFLHEAARDLRHRLEYLDDRALAYRITSEEPESRYRLLTRVVTDPQSDALVLRVAFVPLVPVALSYRVYVFLAPHIGNRGYGNSGRVLDLGQRRVLTAWRGDIALALAASVPLPRASCGFVGVSDGLTDLRENLQLDWAFASATDGNIALTAQLDLTAEQEFTLALGFGHLLEEAVAIAEDTLRKPYATIEHRYISQWRQYCHSLEDLSRWSGDGGREYYLSAMVLKAHEDKTYSGAFIASLSIPWGEATGDANAGGYHLCWPRDLVHIATALLASGDGEAALRGLYYLARTQNQADGSWAQNCWVDGRPYWNGLQLDEVALPILLAWRLARAGVLTLGIRHQYYPMVRAAALCLARCGPVTPQERWEENAGYSPATLAAAIAALVCAAEFASNAGEGDLARYFYEVADVWATRLEDWTYTRCGALLPRHTEHYERIATVPPVEVQSGMECRTLIPLANRSDQYSVFSQCCILDGGFLELVRYSVRAADDPHILATLPVYDALLRVDTPGGPVWHRYNYDGYGEKADGSPYDGTGIGRAWPLLTGERGHYELAAGRDPLPYLLAMECFANEGGMLPEQVWDTEDLPARGLFRGRGTGSATPLAWAHAEYICLLRSRRDRQVFDRINPVYERYVRQRVRSDLVIWKFNHQVRAIRAEQRLRIEVAAPAELHWTSDSWTTVHHDPLQEVAPNTGIYAIAFSPGSLTTGRALQFTFYWPQAGRWEGRDFVVGVV